jgi:hypothetical protein
MIRQVRVGEALRSAAKARCDSECKRRWFWAEKCRAIRCQLQTPAFPVVGGRVALPSLGLTLDL